MKTTAYDIKSNRDITIEVGNEVRRTVLGTDYTLAQLREGADFENRYMTLWDEFLDGNNLYADGVEYSERNCDGYTVRFERDAKIIEEA